MNKKLIALGLSVLTAFTLLTGCAGEKKEAAAPPGNDTENGGGAFHGVT